MMMNKQVANMTAGMLYFLPQFLTLIRAYFLLNFGHSFILTGVGSISSRQRSLLSKYRYGTFDSTSTDIDFRPSPRLYDTSQKLSTENEFHTNHDHRTTSDVSCFSSTVSPPPPPTDATLHKLGLPFLSNAVTYATNNRIICQELPENGGGFTSYARVLSDATKIAEFLSTSLNKYGYMDNKLISVGLLAEPGSEFISGMWGIWAAGFCCIPFGTSLQTQDLLHVFNDSKPKLILVGGNVPHNAETDEEVVHSILPCNFDDFNSTTELVNMTSQVVYINNILNDPKFNLNANHTLYKIGKDGDIASMDSAAVILYTSGTTGLPKGVVLTHRNLYHQVTDLVYTWGSNENDVVLSILPLNHAHGLVVVLMCSNFIGSTIVFKRFQAVALWNYFSSVVTYKPTVFMAVPTIYTILLEASNKVDNLILKVAIENTLSSMRLMVSGSSALPINVKSRWKNMTSHDLLERYGMTEFAIALSNPYRPTSGRLSGHVGLPLPSVEVRIVDDDGKICGPYEIGELQVKGPTVFKEYLNKPEVTKESFDGDFFRTGDIAMYDKELASYRILGRRSVDVIKCGGNKLSALEIERDLSDHPDLEELYILGIDDALWGERVALVCRMKDGKENITIDQLRQWCENRIARYKIPSRLLVLDYIPKNHMGKVNKKSLRLLFDTNQ